ncbi:hypothetical protein HXW73_10405 [Halomonas sp. SH5A2]|uniref:hypothetical protein n=1 Tax=Halomonas sp. SH5A2 TaxID=2749040 RepID=UPI001642301B|nr:hypothetical protein [Halomonas sp. SH5A2]QNI03309.1 hypothetical protein HXW73_10405 [Halomonas sp. SH5A2]
MGIATIVLGYLEVLIWPLLILFALVYFKSTIVSLLEKLAEINIGGEKGFALKLKAARKIADEQNATEVEDPVVPDESNIILSLPDEAFLYLSSLAKKPVKSTYFPASGEELRSLHALSDYGVMKQRSMSEFQLTEIGKTLVSSLEKL